MTRNKKTVEKQSNISQTKLLFNKYYKTILSYDDAITVYWILAILRIFLNIIPQTGYIHPDEFFQSIEIVSGDHFDIDVYKPWEYNVSFPVRSIVFPQLTVGISYLIYKILAPFVFYFSGVSLRTPYYLLLFPRLFMCSISFISDYCLYKICRIWNQPYKTRLIIHASSYITMCYMSRTFSNSIELTLTSLLLFYVARCMEFSKRVIIEDDRLSEYYDAAKTGAERAKYYKLRASLPLHSLNDCFVIATLTVLGIFNRPTFVAFALPPVFFWLNRGLGSKSIGFLDFHLRILTFVIYGIPAVLVCIFIDSFYYGYWTIGEIMNFEISMNNFVVTPVNFIKYNAIVENLEHHGLHPRFLHFLINVPLLFNVLGVTGIFLFFKMLYRILKGRWLELPRVNNINGLMMSSFIVPVLLLSIFPHQEPRFIIPILLPLVFLFTPYLKTTTDKVPTNHHHHHHHQNYYSRKDGKKRRNGFGKLEIIWYCFNILFTIFYGFCHQAGVLPLTSQLAFELKVKPHLTHVHVFTTSTYPIPTGLLHLRNTQRTYVSGDKYKYKLKQDFYLYEMGNRDMAHVYDRIFSIVNECRETLRTKSTPCRIYYALPLNVLSELEDYAIKNTSHKLNYTLVKTFYPHITTEKLPLLTTYSTCTNLDQIVSCVKHLVHNNVKNLFIFLYQFQLLLLKIEN